MHVIASIRAHLYNLLCLFVDVWVYEGHVIIAGNAVAQG
jgi:hypothetical protein